MNNNDFENLICSKDLCLFNYYLRIINDKYSKNDYIEFKKILHEHLENNDILFIDFLNINAILNDLIKGQCNLVNTNINMKIYNQIMIENRKAITE